MKVSLIIPIYNEALHLEQFLERVDALTLACDKELIIVDDASRDGSGQIVDEFKFKSEHKIFHQKKNQGKGAALRRGFQEATGQIVAVQDADFEYDMDDLPALLAPMLQNKADVVFGNRFKKGSTQVHRTFHYMVNRFLTLLSNVLSGLYLSDMETCYKIFRAEIIKNINLESNRFGFEPEITAKLARLMVKVHEIPISYHPRDYLQGKKITWKDGVAALRHLFYFNCLANKKKFFTNKMPKKYIPRGTQWL